MGNLGMIPDMGVSMRASSEGALTIKIFLTDDQTIVDARRKRSDEIDAVLFTIFFWLNINDFGEIGTVEKKVELFEKEKSVLPILDDSIKCLGRKYSK
jgi:hypothetical protein